MTPQTSILILSLCVIGLSIAIYFINVKIKSLDLAIRRAQMFVIISSPALKKEFDEFIKGEGKQC